MKLSTQTLAMLLLFYAQRQMCIVEMLSAIITVFTIINFVKAYKFVLYADIF